MVHPGCGADIIRQRRRKETLKKEQDMKQHLVQSTLEPFESIYAKNNLSRAKNKRYHGHYTPARDSQVFNKRKCSPLRFAAIQNDYIETRDKTNLLRTKKLSRHNSVKVNNMRSLKNQEGNRSKSLEQDASSTTDSSCRTSCSMAPPTGSSGSMAVNSNVTISGSVKDNESDLSTTSSFSSAVSSDTLSTMKYQNTCSTLSKNTNKDKKYIERKYNMKMKAEQKHVSKMPHVSSECNLLDCLDAHSSFLRINNVSSDSIQCHGIAKRGGQKVSLNRCMTINERSPLVSARNSKKMSITNTGSSNSDAKIRNKPYLRENRKMMCFKRAFRLFCFCTSQCRCSSQHDVSKLFCIAEELEDFTGPEDDKLCDNLIFDTFEEELLFYMDLPLGTAMIAEFDDMSIP